MNARPVHRKLASYKLKYLELTFIITEKGPEILSGPFSVMPISNLLNLDQEFGLLIR